MNARRGSGRRNTGRTNVSAATQKRIRDKSQKPKTHNRGERRSPVTRTPSDDFVRRLDRLLKRFEIGALFVVKVVGCICAAILFVVFTADHTFSAVRRVFPEPAVKMPLEAPAEQVTPLNNAAGVRQPDRNTDSNAQRLTNRSVSPPTSSQLLPPNLRIPPEILASPNSELLKAVQSLFCPADIQPDGSKAIETAIF